MFLTHLRLLNFRNHARTEIELGPRLNCFVGQNAQGKSSILEAVEVAATGRSHRAAREIDLLRFGESWARVHATAQRQDRAVDVDILWRTEMPTGAKVIRVNGVPVRRGHLFGHVLIVASSPHDLDVVTGAPAYRRRLVDVVLSQISPAYFFLLLRYARAVEQRNRLLRDLASAATRTREATLEPWDQQLSTMGAAITARRAAMVHRLSGAAREGYGHLAGDREGLAIAYAPSLPPGDETAMIAAARDAFARRRHDELLRGTTLTGPHRDDLRMQIDGHDLRTFGSRGQHQAAMLALRLAERKVLLEESGEEPVLVLDDAAQLLDEERQQRLMKLIERAQALLTLTTAATLRRVPIEAAVFTVAGGQVKPEHAHAT